MRYFTETALEWMYLCTIDCVLIECMHSVLGYVRTEVPDTLSCELFDVIHFSFSAVRYKTHLLEKKTKHSYN
jgi:hypothetical protein